MTTTSATPSAPQPRCSYVDRRGTHCTQLGISAENHCALHLGCARKAGDPPPDNPQFWAAFQTFLVTKNGNWQGFVFPAGIQLPRQIDFPIDAADASFTALNLDGVVFKQAVDLIGATFFVGLELRGVQFEQKVSFERCRFECHVDFLNVQFHETSYYRAEFSGRTVMRANFAGPCNFNEAVFKEDVVFAGWRNVAVTLSAAGLSIVGGVGAVSVGSSTSWQRVVHHVAQFSGWWRRHWQTIRKRASEIYKRCVAWVKGVRRRFQKQDPGTTIFRMFAGGGEMQGVVFLRPNQTAFSEVDLSNVLFRGTNLRGVRFIGVNWWQPKLDRNGLRDEVFIRSKTDGPFRYLSLPTLEETCRNARVALEENKSFDIASDFYIGEMEALRLRLPMLQRHIASVPAWYRFVSNYGTSVSTALRVLLYLLLLHIGLTMLIGFARDEPRTFDALNRVALHTLKMLALQATETADSVNRLQAWTDLASRVLLPVQIAMLALAFRSRIKRH